MNSLVYKLVAFSLLVLILSFVAKSSAFLAPNGANVCSRTVSFRDNYRQSYQVSYRYRYTTSCGFWNSRRCTRYRTAYRINYRTATRMSYRKEYYCCKGWSQVGNQCTKAICTQPCVNGMCRKPDNCSCNSGYYGKLCERDCPSHKWGPHCRHDCMCQNNSKCSPHTGACTCPPGWEGRYCDKPCDQGYYGNQCQYNCTCSNGGKCNPVNGDCACAKGFQGQRCESKCSQGWYGLDCAVKCACLNGAPCDHVNGTCNCTSGWTGDICNQRCAEGSYGYRCAQICHCMHGSTCNHVTGACDCRPGYKGKRCESICQDGTFGQGCQETCACHNNATCSHLSGSCICNPEYAGKHCEHYIERELSSLDHERHTSTPSATLVPSIAACTAVFIIVVLVLAYILYRKKKKSHRHKTTNRPNEPIYATAERPRTSSGHEERTEITDVDTTTNAEAIHVYDTPTSRSTNIDANDGKVGMGMHYMVISKQRSLDSNTYEPLNRQTLKTNQIKVAVYDVPVTKKKTNAYEDIKPNNNLTNKGHYYKGLEPPSTSRADDVSTVAMETKSADQSRVDVVENHYDTPDKNIVKKEQFEDEASGYATPRSNRTASLGH